MSTLPLQAPMPFPMNPGPIVGAGTLDIVQNGTPMPNVRDDMLDWFRPMIVEIVTTGFKDGYANEVVRTMQTTGVLVPAGKPAKIGSSGTRTFSTAMLFVFPSLILNSLDKVVINGVRYRVMNTNDFRNYGYMSYALTEDYSNGGTGAA